MEKSKQNELIIHAYKLGYRISKKGEVVNPKGQYIKSFLNGKNPLPYLVFSIRDYSKWKYAKKVKVKVHKLQAYQKFGDRMFEEKILVRHLNGIKRDNSWGNISIGSQSDNMMDIPEEIRIKSATTASRKMQDSTRSYEERCKIYEDLSSGLKYSEIMLKHNISSKGTLSFMKNKSKEYKQYISPRTEVV